MNEEELSKDEAEAMDQPAATNDAADEAAAEAVAAEEEVLTIEEQLAQAQAKAEEYLDGWKRARAEFDNARKRLQRERQETHSRATGDVVAKMLPLLDDLERALANVPPEIAANSWYEGMELVQRKMTGILEGLRLERIPAVGEPFDPLVHEAISQEANDEFESGVVMRELQPGYRLGDRVLRAALVIVAA